MPYHSIFVCIFLLFISVDLAPGDFPASSWLPFISPRNPNRWKNNWLCYLCKRFQCQGWPETSDRPITVHFPDEKTANDQSNRDESLRLVGCHYLLLLDLSWEIIAKEQQLKKYQVCDDFRAVVPILCDKVQGLLKVVQETKFQSGRGTQGACIFLYGNVNKRRVYGHNDQPVDTKYLLQNCRFFVDFKEQHSHWRIQRNGLPQGSMLAPMLFNIYTRGLKIIWPKGHIKYMVQCWGPEKKSIQWCLA